MSYFEFKKNDGEIERIIYESFTEHGSDPIEIARLLCAKIDKAKALLVEHPEAMIIWRQRPQIKHCELEGISSNKYIASCRFATIPYVAYLL